MATQKTCPSASLYYAHRWEMVRADWLRRNNRRTEAIDAEMQGRRYAARIRDELGVEVS